MNSTILHTIKKPAPPLIAKMNPTTMRTELIRCRTSLHSLYAYHNRLWGVSEETKLKRIDPKTNKVSHVASLSHKIVYVYDDGDYLWVLTHDPHQLIKLTLKGKVVTTTPLGMDKLYSVCANDSYVWVSNVYNDSIAKVDKHSGVVIKYLHPTAWDNIHTPYPLLYTNNEYLWVIRAGKYIKINAHTDELITKITVPAKIPYTIQVDEKCIWVLYQDAVTQVSLDTLQIMNSIDIPTYPSTMAQDGNRIYVDLLSGVITTIDKDTLAMSIPVQHYLEVYSVYSQGHLWGAPWDTNYDIAEAFYNMKHVYISMTFILAHRDQYYAYETLVHEDFTLSSNQCTYNPDTRELTLHNQLVPFSPLSVRTIPKGEVVQLLLQKE